MRPQPELKFGESRPNIVLLPELTTMALIKAPEGVMLFPGTRAPVGYQPSVRYWRMSVAQPAATGHAIEVPLSTA